MPDTHPQTVFGWAVQTDGTIDMRTAGPTRRYAIVNWLVVGRGIRVTASWADHVIEGVWRTELEKFESVKVVPVACYPLRAEAAG